MAILFQLARYTLYELWYKVQIRSISVSVLVTWCRCRSVLVLVLGVDIGGLENVCIGPSSWEPNCRVGVICEKGSTVYVCVCGYSVKSHP
jgi:hypothetical protein